MEGGALRESAGEIKEVKMRKVTILTGVALALCAVLAIGSAATAGTVGKLTGLVTDEKGEPLPGASVVLEGTRRGAVTDSEGLYLILSVDPGFYRATASMVGYHTVTQEQISMRAESTTTVNFTLREEELELEEMVVVAERPPVEPDKTESRYVVTAEDIENVPIIRNVAELVALEAGVSVDGSGAIRSGDIPDNGYFVDGVRMQNQDGKAHYSGYGWNQWSGVNLKAVQEVSVITGGLNAEYGNAQAGVVNIVTKDGGREYHGEVEYRLTPAGQKHWGADVYEAPEHRGNAKWNDPDWVSEVDPQTGNLVHQRTNYTDWRGHYFDGHLGGPLLSNASFFVTARHTRSAPALPGPAGEKDPPNIRTTAKLTVPAGQNLKLRLGWIFDYGEGFQNGATGGTTANTPNVLRGTGRNLFLPVGSPAAIIEQRENMLYAVVTHTINPRTFYELRVSRYQSKQDTSKPGTTTSHVRTDEAGYFYIGRDEVLDYRIGEQNRLGFKLDLSSQVTKGHFVKTGIDYTGYENWYTWEANTPGDTKQQIVYIADGQPGTPIKPKQFAFYIQDKMEFEGFIVNAGVRYDRFWDVNVPLSGAMRRFVYDRMNRYLQVPRFPMRPISNWSPRIGISHPITDRSALHFYYGHLIQLPSFFPMFHEEFSGTGGRIANIPYSNYNNTYRPSGTGAIRPIWDSTQQTISFEVGADWNFVKDYTVALATFYKTGMFQDTGGSNAMRDPGTNRDAFISSYSNMWTEDIRGFEFSIRKDFSNYFSFRSALNIEWAEEGFGGGGNVTGYEIAYPDSNWIATSGYYFTDWVVSGNQETPVPLTDDQRREIGAKANQIIRDMLANPSDFKSGASYLGNVFPAWEQDWMSGDTKKASEGIYLLYNQSPGDRRPRGRSGQGSMQMFFSSPMDFGPGPRIGGGRLLGGVRANLLYRIFTGGKFEYVSLQGVNTKTRGPIHTRFDLNLQKRFRLGAVDADLFLEVFNLFDQRDASSSVEDYMWWGLLGPKPDDNNYLTYGDLSDRSRFLDRPRESHVGVRLRF